DSGDFRYGLAFRRSGNQYYAFTISPRAHTWQVIKSSSNGIEVLAEGEASSLRGLHKAPDQLRVDANGSAFAFQINGQVVTRVTDADYMGSEIGFIVETGDETLAHIHYASLIIRQIDAQAALFADDFADPRSGWPAAEQDSLFFGYHPPDFYHVEVSAPHTSSTVFRGLNFDDFSAETKVLVDHTDTDSGDFRYGLAFRRSGNRHYAFMISPRAQTWQVIKSSSRGVEVLAQGAADSLQGLQKVGDRLRVDASGSNFTFSLNGEAVTQVSDSDYAGGEVGFIVETFDETLAHIHYDSLTIREVELVKVPLAPTATPEPTLTQTPTPIPVPEGMALIPAGSYQMGSSTGQANEAPEHPVLLDAFYIDLFEMTNTQYRACVSAGGCDQGRVRDSFTHAGYRDDPAYDNYPVIGVSWDQAVAYCSWAGKRLPTEAEWEYAASGPENLAWPWGNTFDANLSAASARDTQPVGSYPGGVSPFGLFDMAGNVTEWVADAYDDAFYANSPASNPISGGSGDIRIYRGGAFDNTNGAFYTTSRRYTRDRAFNDVDIGFRCALDATEVNASTPPAEREALVTEFCQIFAAYKPGATCP
ncbi:MAG: formylglycine-generating enzyme family protein, partial [Anaerolineae bacterium]